jgi:L-alanine-DL-glutamate epimerase-like enolase superfamily enzyme
MTNVQTVEMGGPLMLMEDIGDASTWYRRDMVTVPDSPGIGITVDVDRVRRFSNDWWTVEA